jgi:hypothetical protein
MTTDPTPMDTEDGHDAEHPTPPVVDTAMDPSVALGPAVAATGPSSYATREWRGMTVHACPDCTYEGISATVVDRHRAATHPDPYSLTVAERARRAGIILTSH